MGLEHEDLTGVIIGAAIEVHRRRGSGARAHPQLRQAEVGDQAGHRTALIGLSPSCPSCLP